MQQGLVTSLAPIVYLPHGGGPLPLMGEPGHAELTAFLSGLGNDLAKLKQQGGQPWKPQAILVVSAHWETRTPKVTSGKTPRLIYDYSGFGAASYNIQYPAPGAPDLANELVSLLGEQGIEVTADAERGYDHGMFVPLKLVYPDADIPVIQLSLYHDLSPEKHIALGEALSALREKDILVVGSGMSFHNMQAFFDPVRTAGKEKRFEAWLKETLVTEREPTETRQRLVNWTDAPDARYCHPREEHLLPLHVCYGMAKGQVAEQIFSGQVLGKQVSAYLWG